MRVDELYRGVRIGRPQHPHGREASDLVAELLELAQLADFLVHLGAHLSKRLLRQRLQPDIVSLLPFERLDDANNHHC